MRPLHFTRNSSPLRVSFAALLPHRLAIPRLACRCRTNRRQCRLSGLSPARGWHPVAARPWGTAPGSKVYPHLLRAQAITRTTQSGPWTPYSDGARLCSTEMTFGRTRRRAIDSSETFTSGKCGAFLFWQGKYKPAPSKNLSTRPAIARSMVRLRSTDRTLLTVKVKVDRASHPIKPCGGLSS